MSVNYISKTPYTKTLIDGQELTYYPAAARVQRQYRGTGYYPVTCGGIVIGAVQKRSDGTWIAFQALEDGNEVELLDGFTDRWKAVEYVGTTKVAQRAYQEACREGAFGTEAQARIEAQDAAKVDERAEEEVDDEAAAQALAVSAVESHLGDEPVAVYLRRPVAVYLRAAEIIEAQSPGRDQYIPACTEPINDQGGICQAPLNSDGTCPGRKLHLVEMHRRDRDDAIREALRQLDKAGEAQALVDYYEAAEGSLVWILKLAISAIETSRTIIAMTETQRDRDRQH